MGLSLDKANNSKALFKKDGIMLIEALKNAHILNKFHLEWARDYQKNCQRHPANLLAKQKKNFYTRSLWNVCYKLLALLLKNTINLSIKLSSFPKECKITPLKSPTQLFCSYHWYQKSIHFQLEDHLDKKKVILHVSDMLLS